MIFAAIAAAAALAAAAAAGFMPPPAADAAGIGPENPWLIANARALAIRAAASGSTLGSIIAGAGVAALALTGRAAILSFEAWRRAPPRMRKFYEGGFDPEMTKREAALILGVRESAAKDKVLAAHRKVMIANHPDAGGSDYIATKINEAKAKLIKKGGSGSPF